MIFFSFCVHIQGFCAKSSNLCAVHDHTTLTFRSSGFDMISNFLQFSFYLFLFVQPRSARFSQVQPISARFSQVIAKFRQFSQPDMVSQSLANFSKAQPSLPKFRKSQPSLANISQVWPILPKFTHAIEWVKGFP